jgi:hypothetical protein
MANDQEARLRNGTFGAIAGSSVGGIAALLTDNPALVLVGFTGSAIGALIGWLAYLGLCTICQRPQGRRVLDYMVGGLGGVRNQLEVDDRKFLARSLEEWGENFSRMIAAEKTYILKQPQSRELNRLIVIQVRGWMTALVDVADLVFATVGKDRSYRCRASLVAFGRNGDSIQGRHWITYSGRRAGHKTGKPFDDGSIAHQVLCEKLESPHYTTVGAANKEGQDRPAASSSYTSFFTIRVTNRVVMTFDWPREFRNNDDQVYVSIMRDLLMLNLIPSLRDVLEHWFQDVESEVSLEKYS